MKTLSFILVSLILISCQKNNEATIRQSNSESDHWLIPKEDVLFLDAEKDRIQSIDHPDFIPITESNLKPGEMVLVAHIGSKTKIYPLSIMYPHEIVNDNVDNIFFSVSYCPLTGSGMMWNREIQGEVTEFGVSGMLYNENLMPYDRNSGSIWSQMKAQCVNGSLAGRIPKTLPLIETRFSTIKAAFPEALVLDHHDCDSNICERTASLKNDPIDDENTTLPSDQRYFGFVKNEKLLLFNIELFSQGTVLLATQFQGASLLVCGNKDLHFYTAFLRTGIDISYTFSAVEGEFPVIMKDHVGNKYNVFGKIVDGPEKGRQLTIANSYIARTFAWDLFYNDIELFNE